MFEKRVILRVKTFQIESKQYHAGNVFKAVKVFLRQKSDTNSASFAGSHFWSRMQGSCENWFYSPKSTSFVFLIELKSLIEEF